MIKKLLTTFVVLTIMTAFAMAQTTEPLYNSGTITNKGTIKVGCNTGPGGVSLANTATGVVTNDGTIQFTGADPLFANANTPVSVTNNGTIQFDGTIAAAHDVMSGLGTAAGVGTRLGGTVIYNGSGTQQIQGAFYYTNLELASDGAKTLNNAASKDYYVSGTYTAAGGDRTYGNSKFHYDGDAAQDIFAENNSAFTGGTNYYNDLQFEGSGTKTIKTGETVAVAAIFGDDAASAVTMVDGSNLIFGTGIAATISGAITGTNATIQATTGTITIAATTGSVTFGGTGTSLFEIDGATVNNSGAMTFNDGKYNQKSGTTNLLSGSTLVLDGGDFDQTSGLVNITGTMTVTDGALNINGTNATDDLVTIATGGLLNLTASTGVINMVANTNMLVNGSFTSAQTDNLNFAANSTVTYDGGTEILATTVDNQFGNLTLLNDAKTTIADVYVAGNFDLSTNDLAMGTTNKLVMTNIAGTATYTGMVEVTGQMSRVMTGSSTALTFNNTATTVTMTNPGLTELTLNVTPNATLAYTGSGTYTAVDVKRTIGFTYTTTATDWLATMTYGYKYGELPAGLQTDAAQQLLRYREILADNSDEKVSTGNDPLRTSTLAAGSWGQVSLAGINDIARTTLAGVTSGNDLFLRGGPTTYITISDGRWSNPGTWDEGRQPSYLDNTEIKHTVHVGFEGGADKGDPDGQKDERDQAGYLGLAQSIVIDDVAGASLVFGKPASGENSSGQTWDLNTGGIITNNNTTTPTNIAGDLSASDLGTFVNSTTNKYQGLIIFGGATDTGIKLTTNQLVNVTDGNVMVGPNTVLQICQ